MYCIDAPQRIVTKSLYSAALPYSILMALLQPLRIVANTVADPVRIGYYFPPSYQSIIEAGFPRGSVPLLIKTKILIPVHNTHCTFKQIVTIFYNLTA
jgi:hypothetical protein